jgi:phenylpropionate dioxygenase-like ring-hydroxylating dioxygenase large terminal subunit
MSSSPPGDPSAPVLLPDHWYAACESRALGREPHAFSLLDYPLVLFRGSGGGVAVLEDRCPHRNVPLSLGTVRNGLLECAYHGWRFDERGSCRAVPGLTEERPSAGRDARSWPTREQDGLV